MCALCRRLLSVGHTSEKGSYVKRRPTDGAAPAGAAPDTVCAGYALIELHKFIEASAQGEVIARDLVGGVRSPRCLYCKQILSG